VVSAVAADAPSPVGVFLSAPGEEGQADFFQGAPTLNFTGQWKRPWVFRLTLSHSRHAYEEAVLDQPLETFLRLHERAFHDLGGVPRVVKHDNLGAAVVRAVCTIRKHRTLLKGLLRRSRLD
jgi:transposase